MLALVLGRENCIQEWRTIMGPPSSKRAREEAPKSIRALFGTDSRLNAVFGSATAAVAEEEIELLFGSESKAQVLPLTESELVGTSSSPQKTVALIKPDLVQSGKVDELIEKILCRGYQISAREEMQLTTEMAQELYDGYKEIPCYQEMVASITR